MHSYLIILLEVNDQLKKLCLFSVLITFILASCNTSNTSNNSNHSNRENTIIQIAYESLTKSEKNEIKGNWKDATIEEKIVTKKYSTLNDNNYDGKKVYVVTFFSKKVDFIGNIYVYVTKDKMKFVGKGYRD
jgi:hypothetical protein